MSSNLIFRRNSLSSSKFLVDTGASIRVPSPASFSFIPCCRSTTQKHQWFPYGYLWKLPYCTQVWFQTVWLEFSVGRNLCAYPGIRLSPTFSSPGWHSRLWSPWCNNFEGSVTFCLVQVRLVHFRLVHFRLVQVRLDNILPRQHFA